MLILHSSGTLYTVFIGILQKSVLFFLLVLLSICSLLTFTISYYGEKKLIAHEQPKEVSSCLAEEARFCHSLSHRVGFSN